MRQTLHIFRKDVRFLWAPILVVLALTALSAWSHSVDRWRFAMGNEQGDAIPGAVTAILVLSWCYLVSTAIFREALVGDRQFWITRPYRWQSLIAAKALLILTFINLPYLLCDVAILRAHGLAPSIPALLERQGAIVCVYLLPVAALAAVTRDLAQMLLAVFANFLMSAALAGYIRESPSWSFAVVALILAIVASAAGFGDSVDPAAGLRSDRHKAEFNLLRTIFRT